MKTSKFTFYEVVKTIIPRDNYKVPLFSEGVILGMAQDNLEDWHYQVHFKNPLISLGFREDEIESTGSFMKKSDFYDGTTVTVDVGENMRGSLKR